MNRLHPQELYRILSANLSNGQRRELQVDGFQKAAVLVPLIDMGEECTLLFTKRTETVETHKGQVSFPGGVVDGTDLDPIHTALRETQEEIGITAGLVQTLGLLDDLMTPAGFVITPVVGFLKVPPRVSPSEIEVAEVFEIPLSFFANPAQGRREYREFRGQRHEVWFYDTGRHIIWGATANIVRMVLKKTGMIPSDRE
jgi:8-oxo-dGTP pyrophosphatase MutT (NUDIX family)